MSARESIYPILNVRARKMSTTVINQYAFPVASGGTPAMGVELGRITAGYAASATTNIPLSVGVGTGNRIVLFTLWEGAIPSSVTDDAGNTWSSITYTNKSNGVGARYWSAQVTSALSIGQNVTITWDTSANNVHAAILVSVNNVTSIDTNSATNGISNNGATDDTITVTPSAASVGLLFVAASSDVDGDTSSSFGTKLTTYNYAGNGMYGVIYSADVASSTSTRIGPLTNSSHNNQLSYAFFK